MAAPAKQQVCPADLQRVTVVDGGQRAHTEQQRVARQDRGHHETGFGEDDAEQDRVHPDVVVHQQLDQVPIQMQNQIGRVVQQVHPAPVRIHWAAGAVTPATARDRARVRSQCVQSQRATCGSRCAKVMAAVIAAGAGVG
jgi:hypothetical protein